MSKVDAQLGSRVHQHLVQAGVETPMYKGYVLPNEDKRHKIEGLVIQILETLGLDLQDDSLAETPRRVAKMYVDEIFYGLDYANFPKCTTVQNKMQYDEMVIEKNVTSLSVCEHHLVTIDGLATVAYIPKDAVLGLSKINRIVDFFSKRPQIQERLTEQVYHALSFILGTPDVAVSITGKHYCVAARGIRDTNSTTTTQKLGGVFREPAVRAEFLSSIRG